MTQRAHPTDLHILLAVAETGSIGAVARRYGKSEMAIRHRLHRLYREHGLSSDVGSSVVIARAVWLLRHDLEHLAA